MTDADVIESAGVAYRIVNIDTPATNAECAAERLAGERAVEAVRRLMDGAARIEARPTGALDPAGRAAAYVEIDGRDLGEALVARGLARAWRAEPQRWCDERGVFIP